jgi:hypothetical protein
VDVKEGLGEFGLEGPERVAVFALEDGKTHTLELGNEARGTEGRYAILDGDRSRVWVSGKWDTENIFPEPGDFYDLEVVDLVAEDVVAVKVERGEDAFALEKKDDAWSLTVAGEPAEPDETKVEDYLESFKGLKASGVLLGEEARRLVAAPSVAARGAEPDASAAPAVTVTVEAKGDGEGDERKVVRIRFGGEKEGDIAAAVEGEKDYGVVFLFSKSDFEDLAPSSRELSKPAEEETDRDEGEADEAEPPGGAEEAEADAPDAD